MFFNLTTNEHHPLLGTVRAIFGLREVGLETEDFILFPDTPKALVPDPIIGASRMGMLLVRARSREALHAFGKTHPRARPIGNSSGTLDRATGCH
jgi:hypothetical protein